VIVSDEWTGSIGRDLEARDTNYVDRKGFRNPRSRADPVVNDVILVDVVTEGFEGDSRRMVAAVRRVRDPPGLFGSNPDLRNIGLA